MRRSAAPRDDDGMALIACLMVMLLISALLALASTTSRHANRSSVRDRNFEVALNVAESGIDQAIAMIHAAGGVAPAPFSGTNGAGQYSVVVEWLTGERFTVTSTGTFGTPTSGLARTRKVRVWLEPGYEFEHTLYSYTDLVVKNNAVIHGSVWANDSLTVEHGATIHGSVTSAQSWIDVGDEVTIDGSVQTGYRRVPEGFALRLGSGSTIGGGVTVSSTTDCGAMPDPSFDTTMGAGSAITGTLTTLGTHSGPGTIGSVEQLCTTAPQAEPMPTFTFSAMNYDHVHSFTVAEMNDYVDVHGGAFSGTFYVWDAAPSQSNRIDLTSAVLSGDVTIYTNAPVFANGISESSTTEQRFVVASTYDPAQGTECSVNHDFSECSIHIKNNFKVADGECRTSVLLHAEFGPVAVKNSSGGVDDPAICGSIYAEGLYIKNNQDVYDDPELARVGGFGGGSYVRTRFEELPT